MSNVMRAVFRTLIAAALAAAWVVAPSAAQQPPPVSDPTLPSTIEPARNQRLLELPVATSLREDAQPEPQRTFEPLDELPPEDRLPAAPLLVAAYAFVFLALFGYLLSIAKRLGVVQREVERLERDFKKSGRA
jgi:CcmD family protein